VIATCAKMFAQTFDDNFMPRKIEILLQILNQLLPRPWTWIAEPAFQKSRQERGIFDANPLGQESIVRGGEAFFQPVSSRISLKGVERGGKAVPVVLAEGIT
jgi:hypothetical protein